MSYPVIIDADPGIGDAIAVASAILDPEIDLIGLTGVAGRVTAEQATRNLQSVVALLDPPKWPRLAEGTGERPLLPHHSGTFAHDLDGPNGLGNFAPYDVDTADRTEADKLLVDLVHRLDSSFSRFDDAAWHA